MVAAALDRSLGGDPVDSLEVRWMIPGQPGTAVAEWFGRFPAGAEAREDAYLLRPRLGGLSVKLRGGSALDVKAYLGSPGVLAVPGPGQGRLESWRKWSFPYGPSGGEDAAAAGWVTVRKRRRSAWFPLPGGGQGPTPGGCTAELAEADAGHGPWWSIGFEATGPAGLLRGALEHAAGLVFAWPLPPGAGLSLDNSWSYAQWLRQVTGR